MEVGNLFDEHSEVLSPSELLEHRRSSGTDLLVPPSSDGSVLANLDDDGLDVLVCSICLHRLGTKGGPASLPCGHNGCLECLKEAVRTSPSCPICRARVSPSLPLAPNLELKEALAAADRFREALASLKGELESEKLRAEEAEAAAEAAAAAAATALREERQVVTFPHSASSFGAPRAHGSSSPGHFPPQRNPSLGSSGGSSSGGSGPMRDLVRGMVALVKGRAKCREEFFYAAQPQPQGGDFASCSAREGAAGVQGDTEEQGGGVAGLGGAAPPSAPRLGDLEGRLWGAGGGGGPGRPRGMREQELWDAAPPVWVPDSHSPCCMVCEERFKPIVRTRHHCRFCGLLLCHACSPRRCLLPPRFLQSEPQRVCDRCFDLLHALQPRLVASVAAATLPAVHDVTDATAARAWVNSPLGWRMEDEVFKAANSVRAFSKVGRLSPEKSLPSAVLRHAVGLALLTVAKAGVGLCYRAGTGLVVCRLPDGSWSAPSAIATAGVGWGPQLGGEIADLIVVIRSLEAMKAFCGRYHVALGASFSAAAGLMGRTVEADLRAAPSGFSACYTYCCAKGAFVGFSWESSLVATCADANQRFYGAPVSATDLLFGRVAPPRAAEPLYAALQQLYASFDEGVEEGRLRHVGEKEEEEEEEGGGRGMPPPPAYDDCRDLAHSYYAGRGPMQYPAM